MRYLSCIAIVVLSGLVGVAAPPSKLATIAVHVDVPENTPALAKLYMAGNVEQLGPWQPNVFPLVGSPAKGYDGKLQLPIGTELEFKITRGSWATVEKTKDGNEIANRTHRVDGDFVLRVRVEGWAIASADKANTGTGDLRWRLFPSSRLGGERRITVWVPKIDVEAKTVAPSSHDQEAAYRMPVWYFLDGQNIFDAARAAFGSEWKADETTAALMRDGKIPPILLVAIDNSPQRMDEYTPVSHRIGGGQAGGKADETLRFLCDELKPWIDTQFSTDPRPEATTIVGSSLGGLFALHAMQKRPDVIGNAVAMSPSLSWGGSYLEDTLREWSPRVSEHPQRLWIDMGTLEGRTEQGQKQMVDGLRSVETILRSKRDDTLRFHVVIEQGGEHNEKAWARRLPDAMQFLMSSDRKP